MHAESPNRVSEPRNNTKLYQVEDHFRVCLLGRADRTHVSKSHQHYKQQSGSVTNDKDEKRTKKTFEHEDLGAGFDVESLIAGCKALGLVVCVLRRRLPEACAQTSTASS